jgi:hypothetical protein
MSDQHLQALTRRLTSPAKVSSEAVVDGLGMAKSGSTGHHHQQQLVGADAGDEADASVEAIWVLGLTPEMEAEVHLALTSPVSLPVQVMATTDGRDSGAGRGGGALGGRDGPHRPGGPDGLPLPPTVRQASGGGAALYALPAGAPVAGGAETLWEGSSGAGTSCSGDGAAGSSGRGSSKGDGCEAGRGGGSGSGGSHPPVGQHEHHWLVRATAGRVQELLDRFPQLTAVSVRGLEGL